MNIKLILWKIRVWYECGISVKSFDCIANKYLPGEILGKTAKNPNEEKWKMCLTLLHESKPKTKVWLT